MPPSYSDCNCQHPWVVERWDAWARSEGHDLHRRYVEASVHVFLRSCVREGGAAPRLGPRGLHTDPVTAANYLRRAVYGQPPFLPICTCDESICGLSCAEAYLAHRVQHLLHVLLWEVEAQYQPVYPETFDWVYSNFEEQLLAGRWGRVFRIPSLAVLREFTGNRVALEFPAELRRDVRRAGLHLRSAGPPPAFGEIRIYPTPVTTAPRLLVDNLPTGRITFPSAIRTPSPATEPPAPETATPGTSAAPEDPPA